jgi:hypothetical protein
LRILWNKKKFLTKITDCAAYEKVLTKQRIFKFTVYAGYSLKRGLSRNAFNLTVIGREFGRLKLVFKFSSHHIVLL